MTNPQQKYKEQTIGYKNVGYHCFMCGQVYYPQIKNWLGIESANDSQVPITSGIFHKECLDRYLEEYIQDSLPRETKERLVKDLEERLEKTRRKAEIER